MLRTGKTESRQGLALVEVLVSVVIFFAAFAALLRVYALATSALNTAETTVGATLTVQDQLEGISLVETNADAGGRAGSVNDVVPGYVCRVERHVTSGASPLLGDVELLSGRRNQGEAVVVWTRTVPTSP